MKFLLPAVLVFASAACSVAVAPPVELVAEVAEASITCAVAADCPWEWKECSEAVCVSGVCAVAQRAVGTQCTSGVGICLADGTCKAPVGACKAQDASTVCRTSADCVDDEACTWGECVSGLCHYMQDSDGGPCAVLGGACNWGACCAMPTGACEQPVRSPPTCVYAEECDDHDNCTYDSCEGGTCQHSHHPDGTYCNLEVGGDGQCLNGACCLPTAACDLPWVAPKPPSSAECILASECDDHDSCTDDTCLIGSCHYAAHVDGSICSRVGGDSGHCLSAQCCAP